MRGKQKKNIVFRRNQHGSDPGITVVDEHGRRNLYLESDAIQSSMLLADPDRLVLEYSQAMMSALLFQPYPEKVLLIGLGGGSLVRFLLAHCPGAWIDVVEINRQLVEVARRYFLLQESAQLRIIPAPGEEVAAAWAAAGARYDLLLVDAFDNAGPARALLEADFLDHCRTMLAGNGVFVMNLWNRPQDDFSGHYKTLREIFGKATRKLIVGKGRTNALVFTLPTPLSSRKLMQYKPAALELSRRTGINFMRFLRELHAQNIGET